MDYVKRWAQELTDWLGSLDKRTLAWGMIITVALILLLECLFPVFLAIMIAVLVALSVFYIAAE